MTAAFAVALQRAIARQEIQANFRGVGLGDSWISPIDYVVSWGPFLRGYSLIDANQQAQGDDCARRCNDAIKAGQWEQSTTIWGQCEGIVSRVADGVDFYNVMNHNGEKSYPDPLQFVESESPETSFARLEQNHLARYDNDALDDLMNGAIKQKLKIIPANVTWGGQSGQVFTKQRGDFMKDVISTIDQLLDSGTTVVVYTGQLDLICDTAGTEMWMQKLKWSGLPQFNTAPKTALYPAQTTRNTGAFFKTYKNLQFYWILKAGHMVPSDNSIMSLQMVRRITGQQTELAERL